MAATRGTIQGHQRDGRPQQDERSALGHGYITAKANTWQTFATITTWADGHGTFELKRGQETIHTIDWGPQDFCEGSIECSPCPDCKECRYHGTSCQDGQNENHN